jgi:hypothetical protein
VAEFFRTQWRDIAGNVKFWIITAILGVFMSALTVLTHGLKWWQQGALALIYGFMLIWAIGVTVLMARQSEQTKSFTQTAAKSEVGTPEQFAEIDRIYKTYDNQLLREMEELFRASAKKCQAGDEREGFLIRSIATVTILSFFESTWYSIFASQLAALEQLNKGILKMEDLHPYFQINVDQRPQYQFESWFGYLKTQVLVRQDGYNVGITVRGREFLKYMVESGRTATDKPLL